MKIGVFGGTFDPYTPAHAAIVDAVLSKDIVDKVIIVPTVVDYYRKNKGKKWLSDTAKLRCIRQLSSLSEFADKIVVDSGEFELPTTFAGDNRRFVHTLSRITCEYGIDNEYYTILGGDSYVQLGTWWKHKAILALSDIICIDMRNGVDSLSQIPKWKCTDRFITIDNKYANMSATEFRQWYAGKVDGFEMYLRKINKEVKNARITQNKHI